MGFCVNDTIGVALTDYYGWSCQREQAYWSNSYFNGSGSGVSARTTKSTGKPSYKSNASQAASNMAWAVPATGNPLTYANYLQIQKWGNPINTKWTGKDKPDTEESKVSYEGEDDCNFLLFWNCFF